VNLLLGLDAPDDAAVYRITEDVAIVQTVDFFTPIVDDPYHWGAIAAANAVSDIYAMGGKPITGLNLVGWPRQRLSFDLLARVLEGAADKSREAGASIIGGHTVDDEEPKFGMAVTGTVHPGEIVRSSGAREGMSIVLTKPLGMGIASTAIKKGMASEGLIQEAISTMSTLNRGAAEAMLEVGVAAATDVTGFGLIGHLHNLLRLSDAAAELWLSEIPVLEGVFPLSEKGILPGGSIRNADHYSQFVEFEHSISKPERMIIYDAQTSGGLLIAVEPEREPDLIAALDKMRSPVSRVIGKVTEGSAGSMAIRKTR
jgi:selenide,water dikinase